MFFKKKGRNSEELWRLSSVQFTVFITAPPVRHWVHLPASQPWTSGLRRRWRGLIAGGSSTGDNKLKL